MKDAIRFSPNGPALPPDFLDSLLAGDVVFLCGTGVSAQLPDFRSLVQRTYEDLAVAQTDSEKNAFDKGRYEEVLGSLERRLADSSQVRRTVSSLLAAPSEPDLDQHRTVLRLSHNLDNRISVVTTNFDTLLERAATELTRASAPSTPSLAGQALPSPGSQSFYGIVHLHGRLADPALELGPTPLILTSTDYGDAYLRSGWASRFLFDLVRCKAIALLGYSASDAPVRYVLNVLEADRERFPDIHRVYAFDAYEQEEKKVTRRWETLAVTPLPYRKSDPTTGGSHHSVLWTDLSRLADIAERPRYWKRERTRSILRQSAETPDAAKKRELTWLFRHPENLWSVVLETVTDRYWFDVFERENWWTARDATWLIPAWVAKDPQNPERFECAREWQHRLGHDFTGQVAWRLGSSKTLDEHWKRIWHLFSLAHPPRHESGSYELLDRLADDPVMDSDLEKAVGVIQPHLRLDPPLPGTGKETRPLANPHLGELAWQRMVIADEGAAADLICRLTKLKDRSLDILDIATAALRSSLALQADLGLIVDDYDVNDFDLPSISPHAQNRHREGVGLLVRLLVDVLPSTMAQDPDRTMRVVENWRCLTGRTGLRLYLHALRAEPYTADEAMQALLDASLVDFWRIRREVLLLLRHRSADASSTSVAAVEKRIRETAASYYYNRDPSRPGEPDWRPHARDLAVWRRLTLLQEAGALSTAGAEELDAIRTRREHLDRPFKDRDFFGSYIYPVRRVVGDSSVIKQAPEDERLSLASELTQSGSPELEQGWSAYCTSDPQAAFRDLCAAPATPANAPLWEEFLDGLAFSDGSEQCGERRTLAAEALDHLSATNDETLSSMIAGLCNVLHMDSRHGPLVDVAAWVERLWPLASVCQEPLDLPARPADQAINLPAGKLTEALLHWLMQDSDSDVRQPTNTERQLLRRIAGDEAGGGQVGRVILSLWLPFLTSVDADLVARVLKPRIGATGEEGRALRSVMLRCTLTPRVCNLLAQAVKKGALERRPEHDQIALAANLLRPALADIRTGSPNDWELSAADVAKLLRAGSTQLRSAALWVLQHWLRESDEPPEDQWRNTIEPLLSRIWPKERECNDASTTQRFIDLVAAAEDEFPSAFRLVRHYLVPFEQGRGHVRSINSFEMASKHPSETLELLWIVCGPRSRRTLYGLHKVLDQLLAADPALETDRRLLWLDEHAAER